MGDIYTNVDEKDSVSLTDPDIQLFKIVNDTYLLDVSLEEKKQKNIDKESKSKKISLSLTKMNKNSKILSVKDEQNSNHFYTVINNTSNDSFTLAKFFGKKHFVNMWNYLTPYESICIMFTQLSDILVLFCEDCSIRFIDCNTGFPILQNLIYPSKVISFSKYKDNVIGFIMENGDCIILEYVFPRKINNLFYQSFPMLQQQNIIKIDVIVTQMLYSKEYTIILDCYYKNDDVKPRFDDLADLTSTKYIFSLPLNHWSLLLLPNVIQENIPSELQTDDIELDTIYQLDAKLADDLLFFRPEFFRHSSKHISFSL